MASVQRVAFRYLACTALAGTAVSAAQANDYVTFAQSLGALGSPMTLNYGHSFNDADLATAGVQLATPAGITLNPGDFFYDDYAFQIVGSSLSSITATINLGQFLDISNLRVRLYKGDLLSTTTGAVDAALRMQGWSSALTAQSGGSGTVQVISPIDLAPGNYVLEVQGNVTGSFGGSYAGVLNLAPVVPVPEAGSLGLVLAGFGVLGFVGRRRGLSEST